MGETFMVDDVVIGYRYRAGAKWRFSHPEYDVVYTINDFGFRDRKEHLIPKPPVRLVFFWLVILSRSGLGSITTNPGQ